MKRAIKIFFAAILLLLIVEQIKAQDDLLFRRHVINSGVNGLFYGLAIDFIVEPAEDAAAAGIPIIAAGTTILIPILINSSKTFTPNSMILGSHGKVVGWAHGFALTTLIGGESAWEEPNDKLLVAIGALSSISLGIAGNQLGKTRDWSEGQASMFSLYGWTMPLTGTLIAGSFSEEPRLIAASELIFAGGGYLLADKVYKNYNYTRGDARAVQVFSLLNLGLGLGILADIEANSGASQAALLIPAAGLAAGSIAGQLWLKNVNLTPKQGMNTAYATTGGAIFGLGIALITGSDNVTPYYTIPYLTGFCAYAIMVETLRKKNSAQTSLDDHDKSKWNISFMPQNIFLNSKIGSNGNMLNGKLTGMQPLFSASVRF